MNLTFNGISHEELLLRLDSRNIACSMKSACKSDEEGNSHVIVALRNAQQEQEQTPTTAHSSESIRFSFGKNTTKEEAKHVAQELITIVSSLRETRNKIFGATS